MKIALRQCFSSIPLLCLLAVMSLAQSEASPATMQTQPVSQPFGILSFKIVSYYNPLLERPGVLGADERELPRTPSEQVSNARRSTPRSPQERANEIGVPAGAAPRLKIISPAEWVYFTVKNTGAKPIKTLIWDFAFLRLEQGKLALRYALTSQVEIKPGAQKTLRQPLPPGASRCKILDARTETAHGGKGQPLEYVCGRGFSDPSLLKEKIEPVSIQRVEYADGSSWQRP